MAHSATFPVLFRLIAFVASLGVLSSCATTSPSAAVSVYSPPPPRFGSAPIAAYDAYAAATNLPVWSRSGLLADLVAEVGADPSVNADKTKGPAPERLGTQ